MWICTFCLFAGTFTRLPATVSTPLTQPGNFAIKENCPPFQELETKSAKLSLSGSVCVSAYLLHFPHLSLSQETSQLKRIVPPFRSQRHYHYLAVCVYQLTCYNSHTSHSARKLCNQREVPPPPFQELVTNVAKLSLSDSVCLSVSAAGSWGKGGVEMDILLRFV